MFYNNDVEKFVEVEKSSFKKKLFYGILLVVFGISINMAGRQIAGALNLPIFLDCIGTLLVSIIGGYLPGVITGFLSNIISGLFNHDNVYYAVLNVSIALVGAYFANKGYYEKYLKSLITVFPLSFVGGVIGSLITYLIYSFDFGEGISHQLAEAIYNSGLNNIFLAQLSADILIDLADKFVTVTIVFLAYRFISGYIKEDLKFIVWDKNTIAEQKQREKGLSHIMSLRSKMLLVIGTAVGFIALVTIGISFILYNRSSKEEYEKLGEGVATLVSTVVDGDRVEEYLNKGEAAEGYLQVEQELESIRDTSDEILYIYVYRIEEDGCHVVFDLDTDDVKGSDPGEIIEFDEAFEPYLDSLLKGEKIEPIVSNETFGWLLTMYEPIKNSAGQTVAYGCVDISMQRVMLNEVSYLTKIVTLFVGFFLTMVVIGLWLAEYSLILPINSMASSARDFAYNIDEDRNKSAEKFKKLHIHTGDEIENLYDSFSMTIEETVEYIANIQRQNALITKMQNGLIMVLADMVESRDQCTGDHVRKTAAYCRIILEQLRKDHKYEDILTDDYIEDVVNSAPLHDIGKIKVKDAILNKPGKLTPEEFEEIKKHTLAGNEIINQAIALVSDDSSYLKEAKNLATYHHEKYDGTGYPKGLKGNDIPLSARVMAVADVFDALVSKRSYKEPYPFDKAMDIIKEGSGKHFDPDIVTAFIEAKDEVKRIQESFMGIENSHQDL